MLPGRGQWSRLNWQDYMNLAQQSNSQNTAKNMFANIKILHMITAT